MSVLVAAVAGGCSSTNKVEEAAIAPPPAASAAEDSGSGSDVAVITTPMDGQSVMDAAVDNYCEAAALTSDAGDAAPTGKCVQCLLTKCASDLSACSTDCTCGTAIPCLLNAINATGSPNTAYTMCSAAMAALFNGNGPLIALGACTPQNCNCECFPSTCDGPHD